MLNPPPLLKSLDYHHILDIYQVPSWEDSEIYKKESDLINFE